MVDLAPLLEINPELAVREFLSFARKKLSES
jgi:hypothetical protein